MNTDQAISLYLKLTGDIHAYWAAFGALTVLIAGWLLAGKTRLRLSQRLALTIGWFAASGYLASGLMNRYSLVSALAQDMKVVKPEMRVLSAIAELGPLYLHYETIVWTSFGAVSIGALLLIWTDVAKPASREAS